MRCGVEVAPIRAEPREDAEQVTQALRGEPLRVEEERDGWARVVTEYGYPGFVRADHLVGDLPVDVARTYVGSRYEWGGLSAAGIDCSGLVHISYRLCGLGVPRDADEQDAAGEAVPEPQAGDLAMYGEPVDHVAFWLGAGRIFHSTGRDGLGVVEEDEPDELRRRRKRFVRLPGSPL